MPIKSAHKPDHSRAGDVIKSVSEKGAAIASDALPRIADAAQRTGKTVADLAISAGEAIAAQLRKQDSNSVATLGATLATTGALGSVVRFAMRRPVLALVGGIAVAQIGLAIWRRQQDAQPVAA